MKGLDYIGWITASGIAEARHYSGICDNVKVLKSALKREKEFKNRKTVIRMLEVRIRKHEKEKKHVEKIPRQIESGGMGRVQRGISESF